MKRFLVFTVLAAFLTVIMVSCAASKGACDAYTSINTGSGNSNLAQVHQTQPQG